MKIMMNVVIVVSDVVEKVIMRHRVMLQDI
jgi:hypothetical protein